MTGFLSVLDPPVKALRLRVSGGSGGSVSEPGVELLDRFSEQAGLLFGQVRRQQESLAVIAEKTRRWAAGAERLYRHAVSVRSGRIGGVVT